MKRAFLLFAACSALHLAGCGGSPGAMTPTLHPVYASGADKATVVFVRHHRRAAGVAFSIVTEAGEYVGRLGGSTHAVVNVRPGQHRFVAMAENAEMFEVVAEPGRTYLVEVRPRLGWIKSRLTVEGVHRASPRFAAAPGWLRSTRAHVPDAAAGRAWTQQHAPSIERKVARAREAWERASPEHRAARTLVGADGYGPDEANRW